MSHNVPHCPDDGIALGFFSGEMVCVSRGQLAPLGLGLFTGMCGSGAAGANLGRVKSSTGEV